MRVIPISTDGKTTANRSEPRLPSILVRPSCVREDGLETGQQNCDICDHACLVRPV